MDLQLSKELQAKGEVWRKMGLSVHEKRTALKLLSDKAAAELLVAVTKIEEVPVAEENLRKAKKQLETISNDRKLLTEKLNKVVAGLMEPEKALSAAIDQQEKNIIITKRAHELAEGVKATKAAELTSVRQHVDQYSIELHSSMLQSQAKLLKDAYDYALEKISPDELPKYLEKVRGRVTPANQTMPKPKFKAAHNLQADVDAEIDNYFKPLSGEKYVEGFNQQLNLKFTDYRVAWQNKVQAKHLSDQQFEQETATILDAKTNTIIASQLVAMAEPASEAEPKITKDLKKYYALNIEETKTNALIIMACFQANSQRLLPMVRDLKNWFNFGVKQMIAAIEKLKNEDEKFEFTGLTWKQVDKL